LLRRRAEGSVHDHFLRELRRGRDNRRGCKQTGQQQGYTNVDHCSSGTIDAAVCARNGDRANDIKQANRGMVRLEATASK
jgi:hypothetical protein